jgi:pimeloyl-ACP methyl ester carboxylesterase/DNA-binding CsgD family transcriptional regulator
MEPQRLSQLIGLIYDSAVDLDLWPLLLQGLAEELEANVSSEDGAVPQLTAPQVESIEKLGEYVNRWYEGGLDEGGLAAELNLRRFGGEEGQLIGMLLPHFIRALKINRSFVELTAENQAFSSVLDRLPIGMAMIDGGARLYAKNGRFDELLKQHCGLAIAKGHLVTTQREDAATFRQLIAEATSGGKSEATGRAMRLSGATPSSVLILPLLHDEHLQVKPKVMIFITSLLSDINIDPRALQSIYGLTRAESRLTLALVNGNDLDDIAEQYHVSKHTLRTQLKSVYAKTDSRRQAELVVKVLTSPALLAEREHPATESAKLPQGLDEIVESSRINQHMFLSDGRRLSFAEYGPEDGYPTVMMHGLTGSRLQISPDVSCLHKNNIRMIVPDRPGFGFSDSLEERSILDWNRDLAEFVDFLELERFALLGYSIGGSYAMAAASHFQDRVEHLCLVSSMGQYKDLKDLDGMLPMFRILLGLGKFTPSIAMALIRIISRSIRNKPERYFERIIEQSPQMDREVLSSPEIQLIYTNSMLEAGRQGERDMMLEQLMMARDWGFSPTQVSVPTTLWHGEDDRHVPLQMARDIQQQIPRAQMKVIPGAGHFLIFRYWTDIIADLSETLKAA